MAAGMLAAPTWVYSASPIIPMALAEGVNRAFADPLLKILADATRLQWHVISVPFTRLLLMAAQGQALGFGIAPTPDRNHQLAFSRDIFSSGVWTISRRNLVRSLRKVEDLKGYRVCTVRGLNYGPDLEAAKGKLFDAESSTGDFDSRIRMLMAGHCDVLLTTHRNSNAASLQQRVQNAGGDLARVTVGKQALVTNPVHIAVAKGSEWADYLPRIDQAIQSRREQIKHLLDRSV